jgi:hypothetical protein
MFIITRKNIILLIFIILILISSCQISLAAESSVSISPDMITASSGDIFTIDIIVDPLGNEIYGAQYELQFDNNILRLTEQTKGTFLSHGGAETVEVSNNINNTIGKTEYGETRTGDPQEVGSITDAGVLASITFEVIGTGTSELTLDAMLANSSAQSIDTTVSNGICNVVIIEQKSTSTSTETERKSSKTTITSTATPDVTVTAKPTDINQTSGLKDPQTTETELSISTPNQSDPSKENTEQSGYPLAFIIIGLLILSYIILRKE